LTCLKRIDAAQAIHWEQETGVGFILIAYAIRSDRIKETSDSAEEKSACNSLNVGEHEFQ
jgi:hypothetical protein